MGDSEGSRVVAGLRAFLESGRWAEASAEAGGAQGAGGRRRQGLEGDANDGAATRAWRNLASVVTWLR